MSESDPNLRPDLDESTNVVESHAKIEETFSAASREKRVRENGMEPVSLWVLLSSAIVLLVGGAVLGNSSSFGYSPFPQDYVQDPAPGVEDTGPITGPVMEILAKNGKKIYAAKCQGCHQTNGMGDGANFPPLGGSEWVTENTQALAMIIMNGVQGEIEVAGKVWNSNMPGQMPLTATELAGVMTYIRNSFGNESRDIVSVAQAEEAMKLYEERLGGKAFLPTTQDELKADHAAMLSGEAMAPDTIVNFETLQPEEGASE